MTPRTSAPGADLLHLPERVTSWEELADLLSGDWVSLRDGRDRGLLRLSDGLGLVEHAGSLCARERRGLHRRGFRLQQAEGLRVWVWAPPDDGPPADRRDLAASLRRWRTREEAERTQALRTVRGVLGAEAHEVSVVLLADDEDDLADDDEWDDCSFGGLGRCDG